MLGSRKDTFGDVHDVHALSTLLAAGYSPVNQGCAKADRPPPVNAKLAEPQGPEPSSRLHLKLVAIARPGNINRY
jgi:hypothetical protein